MARLRYFEYEELPGDYLALLGDRPRMNLFRMLPHSPEVAKGLLALGEALRKSIELDYAVRELAVLRVGALCKASYEVHQHRKVARSAGMSEYEIAAALREGPQAGLTDLQKDVLHFVDAVVREVKAPAPVFERVRAHFTERQMAELILTIGFYVLVSGFLENVELDIEADDVPLQAMSGREPLPSP